MRTRSFALVAVTLTALLALVGVVYAYDVSRGEEIAEGMTIAGVDVGGMTGSQATRAVRTAYLEPLREPIVVRHGDDTWKLGPRESKIAADVPAMVNEAVERSDEGNVLDRTWRRVTGGTVRADLEPQVTYSRKAVTRLVDRVRADLDRDAVDARVDIGAGGVSEQDGRSGRAVNAKSLSKRIRAAISEPTAKRSFTASVRTVDPAVTRSDLAAKYPVVLIADRSTFELKLYKDLKLAKTYGIAVGSEGYETPSGEYSIANKAVDPVWTVPNSDWAGDLAGQQIPGGASNNPLKARWLGIYDGVGIHGTSDEGSIGSNASHGCLRMRVSDVKDLYPQVPVGAPIYIA